jgi:AcrR family transcriptional regulator
MRWHNMENESLFRKESIVLNTIDVINEFGIQSVSTKEIAKRMNVSEGTVFKYFSKKSDLLFAVLEHYSQYDDDIFTTIRSKNMDPKEAIIFYINF